MSVLRVSAILGVAVSEVMMIPYVDVQLSVWARWSAARALRGVGFSSVSPMFRDFRGGAGYRSEVPHGVSAVAQSLEDTDVAVTRLSEEHRRLVVEYYVRGGKSAEVAGRIGVAKRTLFDRLHAMHQAMLGHLNDVAAGC